MYRLLLLLFVFPLTCFSQVEGVGVNTTSPRKTLDVHGTTKIDTTIKIGTVNPIEDRVAPDEDDKYTFLIQEATSNEIKNLDVTQTNLGNALAYFFTVNINNVNRDWLESLNLRIDPTRFTVVVISAAFTQGSIALFQGHPKGKGFSVPIAEAYVREETYPGGVPIPVDQREWHLKVDFPTLATPPDDWNTPGAWIGDYDNDHELIKHINGNWEVKLLVITKDLVKDLGIRTIDMNGDTDGIIADPNSPPVPN